MASFERFPRYVKSAHEGLSFVYGHQEAGLYFLTVTEGIIDLRIDAFIGSFFAAVQGKYSGRDSKPTMMRPLDGEISSLIHSAAFRLEDDSGFLELTETVDQESGESTVRYAKDGVLLPDENPSFRELYRLVCVANDLLQESNQTWGFVMDGARLDDRMIGLFETLLKAVRARVETGGNALYFLLIDTPLREFSRRILYHSVEFHRIASITQLGAIPLIPKRKCCEILTMVARATLSSGDPLIFFLGAGASFEAGMPLGEAILEHALREIFGASYGDKQSAKKRFLATAGLEGSLDPEHLTSEHVFSYMTRDYTDISKYETFTWLVDRDKSSSPTDFHTALLNFCLAHGRTVVITTNFDTLIERIGGDKVQAVFRDDEFQALTPKSQGEIVGTFKDNRKVGLLKLHGSLADSRTLAMKREHIATLSPGKAGFWESFFKKRDSGTPITMIAIGYGFHDPDLLPRLMGLAERGFKLIIVTPDPELYLLDVVRQRAPQEGAEPMVLSVGCEAVTASLREALRPEA